jgi:RsiW-degrading membrane proteinase PrsW (M82 family)
MDTGISSPQEEATGALTSEQPQRPSPRSRWLNILALVAGLVALVLGPLAGVLFVVLSLIGRPVADVVSVITIGFSMAALGLGLGGALAWVGYRGLREYPSRPFRPGLNRVWGCLAGTGLTLIMGQVILSFDLLAPVTFPLFHVLGITIPAILMLALVAQGLKHVDPAPTQGQVIGQMAWGAFGTTALAFTLEALAAAVGLVVVVVIVALTPEGLAQLNELQTMLADPAQLQDPQALAHWLLKPGAILPVAVILVVVAPLIEEGVKSLGIPVFAWGTGRKISPAQGWLGGIAVGAGFAITEGLFNSAASLPFWAGIVLLRVGATAMHMVTAGFTGLGWARTLDSRRPMPLLGSYLASVTLHGLWNAMTVLIVVSSLWMMAQPGDAFRITGAGLSILVGATGLILLIATIVGAATYVTVKVKRET